MPYETVNDLPPEVRNSYDDNPKQLRAFLAAFNSAIANTPDDESSAFAIAHHAAQGVKSIPLDFYSECGFKALPDNRFIAWYTNPYQDKDKEWFAEKAIESDIDTMQASGKYPELWFYHIEGSKFGQCDTVFKAGRFAIALGSFDDTPQAQAFKEHAITNGFKLSHGFSYDPLHFVDNTYYKFHTFEVSVLPAEAAANPFTFFAMPETIGGEKMAITPQQRAEIEKALKGTGLTYNDIVASSQKASQTLDGQVSYKATPDEIIAQDVGEMVEEPEVEVEVPASDLDQIKTLFAKMTDDYMKAFGDIKAMMEKAMGGMAIAPKAAINPAPTVMEDETAKEIKALKQELASVKAMLSQRQQAFNLAEVMGDFQDTVLEGSKQAAPGQFDVQSFWANATRGTK